MKISDDDDIYRKSPCCPSSRTLLGDLVRRQRKNVDDTEVVPQPEQFYVCWPMLVVHLKNYFLVTLQSYLSICFNL